MNPISNIALKSGQSAPASPPQCEAYDPTDSILYKLMHCDKVARPFVEQKLNTASTIMAFNLGLMLYRNGLWKPAEPQKIKIVTQMQSAFRCEILEPRGYTLDSEVWPLVKPLDVDREQADRAACSQLPGFFFCWNKCSACDEIFSVFLPQRRLCVEAALALGVMARIRDGFYRSDRTPDYTFGHLMEQFVFIADTRLTGARLYPMWS